MANKDKYNIGLEILAEKSINGNNCVTVNLMDLLHLHSQFKKANTEAMNARSTISNLISSNRSLLDALESTDMRF